MEYTPSSAFGLRCMPGTPMSPKEMQAQCNLVSHCPEVREDDEEFDFEIGD